MLATPGRHNDREKRFGESELLIMIHFTCVEGIAGKRIELLISVAIPRIWEMLN